jgi:bifunctional enzyme CysN/CysC
MPHLFTCGSVDDGKSTLLGRLLFDTQCLPDDLLAKVTAESRQRGFGGTDYSLAFDGLIDEKAQGITIDVAWRYVTLQGQPLVLADCPGHTQYTRNMVSAASQCDAGILLVDAARGITAQTRRHLYVCSLMRIRHLFVAVNKIDLVADAAATFAALQATVQALLAALPHPFDSVVFAPTSGVQGTNVVQLAPSTPWYSGPTLLQWVLQQMQAGNTATAQDPNALVMPVQRQNRPNALWRGYDGTVAQGTLAVGQAVHALPGGQASRIKAIHTLGADLQVASAGRAVSVMLQDELDLARGDVLVADHAAVTVSELVQAHLVWFGETPASLGARYELRLATCSTGATLAKVQALVDMDTLETQAIAPAGQLVANTIALAEVMLEKPVALMRYAQSRTLGGFLLVDRVTHETVAAGMVLDPAPRQVFWQDATVGRAQRMQRLQQKPMTVWLTGLSGAGKTTLANAVESALHAKGFATYLLDGDNIRHGLCRDLGFSEADRAENMRRVGEVARLMVDAGLIVLASFISPSRPERDAVRQRFEPGDFAEVYVSTPLAVCEQRDTKGLYKLARAGKIGQFTGVSAPYDAPLAAELTVDTTGRTLDDCARQVVQYILERQ